MENQNTKLLKNQLTVEKDLGTCYSKRQQQKKSDGITVTNLDLLERLGSTSWG